jgi:hypothetical protein
MKPDLNIKSFIFFILASIAAGGRVYAVDFPRTVPEDYIFSVRDDYTEYDGTQIIEASLLLSGVKRADLEPYVRKAEAMLRDFHEFIEAGGAESDENSEYNSDYNSDYKKGEAVLTFLHDRVFKQYSELQTRTNVVLDTGVYNCVSSAVFFAALAKSLGMSVDAVSTDDHVFCSIVTEKGEIDVETTSAHGFDPGVKREFTDSFGKTGFTYVPPGNYSRRNQGDLLDLLSFILQNRVAELQKRDDYFNTVGISVDRYALLGDEKAKELLITELINYAASLNKQGRYIEGIDFLDYADDRYNTGTGFYDIYATLTNNVAVQYTEEHRFQEAAALIGDWKERKIVTSEGAADLEGIIYDREAFISVQHDESKTAEALVKDLYNRGKITRARYVEFIVYLYGKQAESAGNRQDWLSAAEIMADALGLTGDHPQLTRALKGYRDNYAIQVHNQFAGLYNAGEYRKANDLVADALSLVPENRLLLQDLDAAGKALGGDG